MSSFADTHRWATIDPAYVAMGAVLFLAAAATLLCGLLRSRAATRLWLPGVTCATLSATAMWPLSAGRVTGGLRGAVMAAALAALLVHTLRGATAPGESTGERRTGSPGSWLYLTIVSLAAGVFLFRNLGGYSGEALLGWETTVIRGFGQAFVTGESVSHFTLQRFLWDDGTLSAGYTSLFYGAPT